jgi:hypothetical protein
MTATSLMAGPDVSNQQSVAAGDRNAVWALDQISGEDAIDKERATPHRATEAGLKMAEAAGGIPF